MKNGFIIDASGTKKYYLNGEFHREDGPAIEYPSGTKIWYQYNKTHREDGPAVEYASGNKEWYFHGKYIDCKSQEEFERLLKLRVFW